MNDDNFSLPQPAAPVLPQAPAAPPMFGSQTQGQKPQAKSSQPTFLGAQLTANPSNTGQKTLLGEGSSPSPKVSKPLQAHQRKGCHRRPI